MTTNTQGAMPGELQKPVLASLLNIILNHEARATPEEVRRMAAELVAARAAQVAALTAPPAQPAAAPQGVAYMEPIDARAAWSAFERMASDQPTGGNRAAEAIVRDYLMQAACVGPYRASHGQSPAGAADLAFMLKTARLLAELHGETALSEQQCAKHMGIDLVSWRRLEDCFSGGVFMPEGGGAELPREDSESVLREALGLQAAPTAQAAPACKGSAGECTFNGACMYACGATPAAGAVAGPGWKWMPVEPTLPMLIKGSDTDTDTSVADCRRVYRAMLSAAPTPAAPADSVLEDAARWNALGSPSDETIVEAMEVSCANRPSVDDDSYVLNILKVFTDAAKGQGGAK